jgi:SAM-dependent methyltransferase
VEPSTIATSTPTYSELPWEVILLMDSVSDCYNRSPIAFENDIPIFSASDSYVENYERISADHLVHFEVTGHNPFMREDHWQEVEDSTRSLLRKYSSAQDIRILDVGVGMGRLLEPFSHFQRFGMDISRGYLKHAKARGIEVCLSRIEDMPYQDDYFDVVVTTDVLEHVIDLNLAIHRILSVVKHDGILIVRVPYKEDLSSYLLPSYPYDLVHVRNFDEHSLRLLFEKIFRREVLEWTVTGFRDGKLRFSEFRYYAGGMSRVLRFLRGRHDRAYEALCRKLCLPTEINMVIRNNIITSDAQTL